MNDIRAFAETSKSASFLKGFTLVVLSSILIGLFGKVVIPLPFTPVPIATQPSLILLLALLLGPRRGVAAVALFLGQGALGLPVFAGGFGGIARFFMPTGGYLIGYLAAAFVVGILTEKLKEKTLTHAAMAMAAGNLVIYVFGASYLSTFVGFQKALLLGVAPFLLGDALKLLVNLKIVQWLNWSK